MARTHVLAAALVVLVSLSASVSACPEVTFGDSRDIGAGSGFTLTTQEDRAIDIYNINIDVADRVRIFSIFSLLIASARTFVSHTRRLHVCPCMLAVAWAGAHGCFP
jgi:hypothetical protein